MQLSLPSIEDKSKKVIKQVYHAYQFWEDYQHGMWSTLKSIDRKQAVDKAIIFTGDHVLYGSYMLKVIKQWPISCEHNLTDLNINRKAWIGHAACCMATGLPEL